jgi:Uri superfamily endonuclease
MGGDRPASQKRTATPCTWRWKPQHIRVGALGELIFRRARYVYLGSAAGPGGLRPVRRHLRADKTRHWHIDYLVPMTKLLGLCWTTSPDPLECRWSQALARLPLSTSSLGLWLRRLPRQGWILPGAPLKAHAHGVLLRSCGRRSHNRLERTDSSGFLSNQDGAAQRHPCGKIKNA